MIPVDPGGPVDPIDAKVVLSVAVTETIEIDASPNVLNLILYRSDVDGSMRIIASFPRLNGSSDSVDRPLSELTSVDLKAFESMAQTLYGEMRDAKGYK